MRSLFDAALVNRAYGDPGILIDLKVLRRALLFDVGDISGLMPKVVLRISDLFVSHTHMDHFAGFDRLLRVGIGRSPGLSVYGPPRIINQVEHKLAAYTWNLVDNYATDFVLTVHELAGDTVLRAQFRGQKRFEREDLEPLKTQDGVLLTDPAFRVRALPLVHHDIVSLAFAFEESIHINVWKNRLTELGLPTGAWLTELKARVRAGEPDDTPIRVHWRTREGGRDEEISLGELKAKALEFVEGQRVCYVTDVADTPGNREALRSFLKGTDLLFIETVFLDEDRDKALRKAHLTARAAGEIAREAGARQAVPFHFSTRYMEKNGEQTLKEEFESYWRGSSAPPG